MTRIATLLTGHGLTALATLARNLVVARLLGPEDYGLAVALIIITAAAEMGTALGLPQQIISHKHGGSRRFQATLHTVQLARGVFGTIIVLCCAAPLATALGAPEATPTLRTAALVPLVLGFTHLDPYRGQRHRIHLPQIMGLAVPALISAAAIWPLSVWQTGPRIMLSLLLIQACASVTASHLLSCRPYRLSFHSRQIRQVLRYGLPLAANGFLMFAVLHAEKLIAGGHLGLADMGLLAMGLTLTLTPALIMARSFHAFFLPRLRKENGQILALAMLLGASLCIILVILIKPILSFLGAGFDSLAAFVPILSCLAAMRLPKSALATTALAQGRTYLPALANLPRLLAAPVIWQVLDRGGGIEALLCIAMAAEIIGVWLGILLSRSASIPVREMGVASLALMLVLSGQLVLATLVCALGWALFAVGPSALSARSTL